MTTPGESGARSVATESRSGFGPDASIFLIGYRCVGKTTVARLLAERLGWRWKDADAELERRHGRSIRQLIADEGEALFRDREASILQELCALEKHIIATGGGAVLHPGNRERLRAAGRVVWLTADLDTTHARLQADPESNERRPALNVGGRAEIESALTARAPLYRACADWQIETSGRPADEIAAAVVRWIQGSKKAT